MVKKKKLIISVIALVACAIPTLAATDTGTDFFQGIQTNFVYMQSLKTGNAAGAVAVSIPLLDTNIKLLQSKKVTFNADAIALADNDKTRLAFGGSATIPGLSVGDISVGLAFVPSGDMGWTGYVRLTPIKF